MSYGPTHAELLADEAKQRADAALDVNALALHLSMRDRDRMRTLEALEVFQRAQFRDNY